MSADVGEGQPVKGSTRVSRRRDRRKAEIIKVANTVLADVGYSGMSLEDVAEQTDIAKATLYHYFSSKDELVAEALEALTQEVLRRLRAREEAVGEVPAREMLAALIDEQILILTETAPEVAAAFSWPRAWPEAFEEPMKDMRRRHDEVFRTVAERGIADGEFSVPNLNVTLQCLHGILNQASVWLRPEARSESSPELRADTVAAALRLFG
ncbi:TetR/AcrR family transcriptional regulator [Gordonia hydrophobica]|uniref:TetR/AcrR family transcriptional regulator n=1 Tax=Gordonia hydrophobica TaxID=40516 RepID=A0ABZ2U6R0_9ACTN|nr:TetR/AcrR family transcriptional regulator [Gordonia hydrophobica]MBM7365659.1 AcrR family transcriptional regulator [Gordonia hydrophobica]